MLILVGLGNPGTQYALQRHNVGFMAVDAIADSHGFGEPKRKFNALLRDGFLEGPSGRTKVMIVKPQTYMNESGKSVGELLRFYKLTPEDIFVFHDELDLAPAKLRIKDGGGHAGHNGLRSIDAHIGKNFKRVRIGIGHPGSKAAVHNYVLGNFAKSDKEWLTSLLDSIARAAPHLIDNNNGPARFQSKVAAWINPNQHTEKLTKSGSEGKHKTSRKPASPEEVSPPIDNMIPTSNQETTSNPFQEALRKILPGKK